jgi:acyl-CoA-dependent ceramide synthase
MGDDGTVNARLCGPGGPPRPRPPPAPIREYDVPSSTGYWRVRSVRRKAKLSQFATRADSVGTSLELALAVIVGMAVVHVLSPRLRRHTRKFFSLSYATSTTSGTVYTQGVDDLYFVVAWIVYFTALRAMTIEWLLQPLARILGIVPKSQLRFAEQGWIFLYYSTVWVLGMVRSFCKYSILHQTLMLRPYTVSLA